MRKIKKKPLKPSDIHVGMIVVVPFKVSESDAESPRAAIVIGEGYVPDDQGNQVRVWELVVFLARPDRERMARLEAIKRGVAPDSIGLPPLIFETITADIEMMHRPGWSPVLSKLDDDGSTNSDCDTTGDPVSDSGFSPVLIK